MASPNVSFDTLPASIRKPGKYFEFNTRLAVRTLPANRQKVLIIAPNTNEGTLPPYTPLKIFSDIEAREAAGKDSIAYEMCKAAITANRYIDLSLMVLEDKTSPDVQRIEILFSGKAQISGSLFFLLNDTMLEVTYQKGDTCDTIRRNTEQLFQEKLDNVCRVNSLGFNTTEIIPTTLNAIELQLPRPALYSGISVRVKHFRDQGRYIAEFKNSLASIFGEDYDIIITPFSEDAECMDVLKNHLDATGHALEQRGAIGVCALTSPLASAISAVQKINSGRITVAILPETTSKAYEVAAAYGAVLASEEDPARPLNLLPLTGISAPPIAARLGRVEQETALYNGITPLAVGPGEKVQIVRAISTYIKDPQGIDDISLLDITTIRTLDYVRKACRERISLRFPREKLSAKTAKKVRSELIDVLVKLEELEIVECVKENLPMLIIERDSQDPNRLNAAIPCDVVNGLHVFAGRIDLLL